MRRIQTRESITVRVPEGTYVKIEKLIKQEYPKLKTFSEVVRLALDQFFEVKQNATENEQ